MNAEKLHDALNQLPDDLIAAADALRQRRKKSIPFKRLVPIAACFALVLGALYVALPLLQPKGSMDAAPEAAAPMEMMQDAMSQMEIAGGLPENGAASEAPAEEAPRMDPEAKHENDGAPLAPDTEEVTTSTGAFGIPVTGYSYCIGSEEPEETEITIISTWKEWNTFLAETPRLTEEGGFENGYEEAYFEEKQLIAVMTTAASSSVGYEVESMVKTGTGTWMLTIIRYNPEWFTDDMTQQLILIELPRTVEPEDTITLNLEIVEE